MGRTKRRTGHVKRNKPAASEHNSRSAGVTTHEKLLKLQLEVIEYARQASLRHNPPTELERFDRAIFERALSVLHAVYVLAKEGHWETANAPVRQLFELLVNMEHLNTRADRELAAIKFVQFGSLQESLAELGELEFAQTRGHGIEAGRLLRVRAALDQPAYAEFRRGADATGRAKWAKSWSGKTLSQLCEESPKELRQVNYRTLFSDWSEQAHGTPGALVRGIISSIFPERPYLHDDLERTESVIAMALVQFLELWEILPGAPPLEKSLRQEWLASLQVLLIARRADKGPMLIEFRQ